MAYLEEITGKAISGEWGDEDTDGNGVPVLRAANFTDDGGIDFTHVVTRSVKKDASDKLLRPGDIILEKSGGSDTKPVGRVAFYDGPGETYLFNNFTGLLRVRDTSAWIPKYVFYALFANYACGGTRRYENRTTGIHNLRTGNYVSDTVIPDKPVWEQEKAVSTLDKVSGAICLRKRQLAKLDELVKARFIEMFGNPLNNTRKRPIMPFHEVVTMQRGFDLPIQERQRKGSVPVFGSNGALDHHNIAKARDGVITGRSGTIGKVYYVEGDYWPLNTTLFSVNTHGNNIIYLAYLLELYDLTRFSEGTGVPTLNRNTFHNNLIIDVPLHEQEGFSAYVEAVNQSKSAVQRGLEKLETLKAALMQQYFG